MGASTTDRLSHGFSLVGAEVVHDNDVAGPEGRNQKLFDPRREAYSVYGPVEDTGCLDGTGPQGGEECHGRPMAMGGRCLQALPPWTASPQGDHVGLDPCFIDKQQAVRIKPPTPAHPAFPLAKNIRPVLFVGVYGFF